MGCIQRILFISAFLISQNALASSITGSGGYGNQAYRSYLLDAAIDTDNKTQVTGSGESEGNPGQMITQFKVGANHDIDDHWNFNGDVFYRDDAGEDNAIGIEPNFSLSLDSLLLNERTTTFNGGSMASVYSTDVTVTGPHGGTATETKHFAGVNGTFGIDQELLEGLKIETTFSFYYYSQNPNNLNGVLKNKRKIYTFSFSNASILSTFPTQLYQGDIAWEFAKSWTFTPGGSIESSLLVPELIYSWSMALSHDFSQHFTLEGEFSASSSGTAAETLSLTYNWGGSAGKEKGPATEAEP